jgi:3-deoxy-D-manno-octulosonic-acid transferase
LLEPAAVGTPSVTGPHLHNFSEISRRMREAGAVAICEDASAVADALQVLLIDVDARRVMVEAGLALVANGRGAVQRTLAQIAPHLPPVAEPR